jgi:hypothetical protein
MRSSGALLVTVILVFLLAFPLEMPGSFKWLALVAFTVNLRWWWFWRETPRCPRT